MIASVHQQAHGYRNGHQLLWGTIKLSREDQDAIDRLSDMAGPLRPGETFKPYLTGYPIPSGTFYVLARTWQDRAAPRAGCVLTRSLFIPIAEWEVLEDLPSLIALLTPIASSGSSKPIELAEPSKPGSIGAVSDPRTPEIVEALFLESRQPTVVFEASEADLIAERLLMSLWPAMRRSFAVCTFALAPRKLGSRDFDLVFAPKSARSRFADWNGRRIEASNTASTPRHRWTQATAERIFTDARPSLANLDALGVMRGDDRGDSSVLRLSLLWNELSSKSESSPNAVLGMLDILSSLPASKAPASVGATVDRALRLAVSTFESDQAWNFIATLLGKYERGEPPKSIRQVLAHQAEALAKRDPAAAIELLMQMDETGRETPTILLAAIGNGLSQAKSKNVIHSQLVRLDAEVVLKLLAFSRCATRWLGGLAHGGDMEAVDVLKHGLIIHEPRLVARVRRALLRFVDTAPMAHLISPLFRGLTTDGLVDVVRRIGKQTEFKFSEFDAPIISAATTPEALLALRSAALEVKGKGADRLVLGTLRLDRVDFEWLQATVIEDRARSMLTQLVDQADDRALQYALRDARLREEILTVLRRDMPTSISQLHRIVEIVSLPNSEFLEIGQAVLENLPAQSAESLALALLTKALSVSEAQSDVVIGRLLSPVGSRLEGRQLIRMLTPPGATTSRIAANLGAVSSGTAALKSAVVARVDELSSRLVVRGRENLGPSAYLVWSQLLADAAKVNPIAQLAAAAETLPYALRHPELQVSPLVRVAFPLTYRRLLQTKTADPDILTAFFALPLTLFASSPDQAKAARRELVDAFLRSNWPPADLILTTMTVGVEQKALKRVNRAYHGNKYIGAIERDAKRLSASEKAQVVKALSTFRSARKDDWDD